MKGSLSRDVKGMLSLYEASFLSYEGEQILDEAKAFTSFHLRGALKEGRSNTMLLEQVNHALELPLYHRIQRLEARWYIESYAKRKDANRVLLQYCAVNASKWSPRNIKVSSLCWNDLRASVQWYPQRFNQSDCLITSIDDMYDVYGTLVELELFITAVES